jgi:hypothetical protein
MKNIFSRNKLAFIGLAAAVGLAAPAATAANPHVAPSGTPAQPWSFATAVSAVVVVDQSVQSGTVGTYAQIDFVTPGTVCGTNNIPRVFILRSEHPEQFDSWVRLAQSAFLSGRRITYASAKRTTSSNCYTWYITLRD